MELDLDAISTISRRHLGDISAISRRYVTVRVSEELDLDVSRRLYVPFDEDTIIAKRRSRLARRDIEAGASLRLIPGDAHSLPATAG